MSTLRSAYEKSRVIGPLHTGGPVAVTEDGSHIATCVGEEVLISRISEGSEVNRLITDTEAVHSICFTPSSSHVVVFTASLTLHVFENPLSSSPREGLQPSRRTARAHDAPVHVCRVDSTSTLLASGSADGVVKIWDIHRGYVTHMFRGHGGVVSALAFRRVLDPNAAVTVEPTLQLVTASVDTRLRVFDLSSSAGKAGASKPIAVLEGHDSVPRGLDVSVDGRWLISAGRDSVALLWELSGGGSSSTASAPAKKGKKVTDKAPSLVRTIPILERVEAAGWIDTADGRLHFYTAGEKGLVKIWDAERGSLVHTLDESASNGAEKREILAAYCIGSVGGILTVDSDQIIALHSLSSRSITQQLIGFNDEIVAVTFLSSTGPDSHIAVATNSPLIRVYSMSGNDARLLHGHSEIVLCLDHKADGRVLASGSKDNSARLWSYSELMKCWSCIAVCEGHAESVGAVALSRKSAKLANGDERPTFMFTGSQDRTIKMWNVSILASNGDARMQHLKSLTTVKAHDKDINALDVSSNDQLLASASQDKTAKIFEITYLSQGSGGARGEIKLLGTCKGHKRGVWTVKFGRSERVLATGSGDHSVKLWNLNDFSCVKTFEGHTNSVLQVEFLNQDLQLVSTASDGLLKSWNVRTEECIGTMDNHEDKVWALAVSSDESTVVTGAADSVITFWRDCTEEKELERQVEHENAVLREQDLMNYIMIKDYHNALVLALSLNQPGRLLSLFKQIILSSQDDLEGQEVSKSAMDAVLKKLSPQDLIKLLKHVRDWNTSAKTSGVSQTILYSLLKLRPVDEIAEAFNSTIKFNGMIEPPVSKDAALTLSELVQAMLPYTERHLARLDRLIQDSYIIDYVLKEMDGGIVDGEIMEIDF